MGGEKNPSRKEMWFLSHHHATNTGLLLCSSMYFRNCVLLLLKRMHYNRIILHPKKSLIEVNRALLQRLLNLLELRLPY